MFVWQTGQTKGLERIRHSPKTRDLFAEQPLLLPLMHRVKPQPVDLASSLLTSQYTKPQALDRRRPLHRSTMSGSSSSGKGPTKARSTSTSYACAQWQPPSLILILFLHYIHMNQVVDFRSFGERPAKGLATSLYIGGKIDAKVSPPSLCVRLWMASYIHTLTSCLSTQKINQRLRRCCGSGASSLSSTARPRASKYNCVCN